MDLDDMAIDSTYSAHGRAAAYMPPSGDTDDLVDGILVCFHEPQAERDSPGMAVREFGIADKMVTLLVRRSEVIRPEAQGVFNMASGIVFTIGEVVKHDAEGREWRCRCADAA